MILARLRRTVTQADFDKIECTRCGACCEAFTLPSVLPYRGSSSLVDLLNRAAHPKTWGEERQGRPGSMYEGDLSINEYNRVHAVFTAHMMPIEEGPSGYGPWNEEDGRRQGVGLYRCDLFERDADGRGCCTDYANRPPVCADFPYHRTTLQHVECAWHVTIFDFEPLLEVPGLQDWPPPVSRFQPWLSAARMAA